MTSNQPGCCEKCAGKHTQHSIANHADDFGITADHTECYCDEKCRAIDCPCHKPGEEKLHVACLGVPGCNHPLGEPCSCTCHTQPGEHTEGWRELDELLFDFHIRACRIVDTDEHKTQDWCNQRKDEVRTAIKSLIASEIEAAVRERDMHWEAAVQYNVDNITWNRIRDAFIVQTAHERQN